MMRFRGLTAAVALAVATALPLPAAGFDQDVIDYRQSIMKTMREQAAIIGMILENKAPSDDFAAHVRALAVTAATAKKAFEPEVVGGDAKAEVWEEWADFAERLDAIAEATAELAELAENGGVAAAAPQVRSALTCKSCHDKYRQED